ncbi:telomere-associated protein Tap [Streptomyces sp. NPDC059575]|uniref:telomere-associated protein Tap n=1 Tax=Streptomyces sp. NPDC059575 TaxID=3346872 RepID=UPI003677AD82
MASERNRLFASVDALLEQAAPDALPDPAERKRLRESAGLSQDQVAQALGVRRETVSGWEGGRAEPRAPKRAAYIRLLDGLATRFPPSDASPCEQPSEPDTQDKAAPQQTPSVAPPAQAEPPPAPQRQARTAARQSSPGEGRFTHGPLTVVDGDGHAYGPGGLVLDCPLDAGLAELTRWALDEAQLGAPRLHRAGRDSDPLVVLTAAAAEQLGLPENLEDRRSLRLPDAHPVVRELLSAGWKLTKRGFGPWPRVYQTVEGARRRCVQFAVLPWGALDERTWKDAAQLPAPELAHVLGAYAARVLTPRGSAAVTGLELMTALRPPTRAVKDAATGAWVSGPVPGSLTESVDCALPEAPDGHPLVAARYPRFHQRTPDEILDEEAYQWARPLTDDECLKSHVVGIDVNMAFAAAANRLTVGLSAPVHVNRPAFDAKTPGSWLVDLSHIPFDERLPNPFTPTGETPTGPAWYATPTVAYAVELGHLVTPLEAYLRQESGSYLDGWYTRLRDAYIATMADLGVTPGMPEDAFLKAMAAAPGADPAAAAVLSAIKATVKGGIGKLRERPHGGGWRPGEPWPALARATWRPDIRAAVIASARINMHRKMLKLATHTGLYPVAVLSDCAVYPSPGPSPLDFLPHPDGKPLPGTFRLGVSPGMVKHEGTQSTLWAEDLHDEHGPDINLARHIKTGTVTHHDTGE